MTMTPAQRLALAFPRLTMEQAEIVASLRPEGTPTPGPLAVALRLTGAVRGVYRPLSAMVAGEEALAMSPVAAQVVRSDTLCLAHVARRFAQDMVDALLEGQTGEAYKLSVRLTTIMEQVLK